MKKCPFCAEEIQDEAIKCRFCNEFFKEQSKTPWYYRTSVIVFAFLCVGPFALPLVWLNQKYNRKTKIIITVVVILLTYLLSVGMAHSVKVIKDYYKQMMPLY